MVAACAGNRAQCLLARIGRTIAARGHPAN
jgi:hypothetical protein